MLNCPVYGDLFSLCPWALFPPRGRRVHISLAYATHPEQIPTFSMPQQRFHDRRPSAEAPIGNILHKETTTKSCFWLRLFSHGVLPPPLPWIQQFFWGLLCGIVMQSPFSAADFPQMCPGTIFPKRSYPKQICEKCGFPTHIQWHIWHQCTPHPLSPPPISSHEFLWALKKKSVFDIQTNFSKSQQRSSLGWGQNNRWEGKGEGIVPWGWFVLLWMALHPQQQGEQTGESNPPYKSDPRQQQISIWFKWENEQSIL